jgi:hypothetical protein
MNRRTVAAVVWGSVLTAAVLAQAPTLPKPGPEQKKPEVFVGTWTYDGEAKKIAFGPA